MTIAIDVGAVARKAPEVAMRAEAQAENPSLYTWRVTRSKLPMLRSLFHPPETNLRNPPAPPQSGILDGLPVRYLIAAIKEILTASWE